MQNYLNQIFPKDLVNIVNDYMINVTHFDNVLVEYWKWVANTYNFRDIKRDARVRSPHEHTKTKYSDKKRITNSFSRGSTMTYIKPTTEQIQFNKVMKEFIHTRCTSNIHRTHADHTIPLTYKFVIYYFKHKHTDVYIRSLLDDFKLKK
jgi:hypothetical protein